jgi:tetratricopeptide (TPR) repeat protein
MYPKFFLVAFMVAPSFLSAQTTRVEQKVVPVLTTQSFYLNSAARANLGGKAKTWIPIDLPPNTVEWYYSFTTAKNENAVVPVNLAAQLTKLIDPTGLSAMAATSILTPTGAGVCDIYLVDKYNLDAFIAKADAKGESFEFDGAGSRQNYKNGTVHIKDLSASPQIICFRNPSTTEGVSITIDVVAVVEETITTYRSESDEKADIYAALARKAYDKCGYDKCLDLCKRALELNPQLGDMQLLIGLVHLVNGQDLDAIDRFSTAMVQFKKAESPRTSFETAINDLKALLLLKPELDTAAEVMEMMEAELKALMANGQ